MVDETYSYYWSASTLSFYPMSLKSSYDAMKTWPTDAVGISDDVFKSYALTSPPDGKQRGVDANGMPTWVDQAS
ncbi:MAG: hypothetical protein LKH33_10295 [Acetobacter sp.]|jgi:hypothetical protein|nr:hypothetical protein [Acetobacter sp.]MCH4060529.1 hypothetical protein [Acetobacter sp.]MCH4087469.1 hypothetical protein [Acetobacter sp.]MCI1294670.1 hypothetical protein [Acetobacter sp.]MCI1321181.1 hypothetical protein [Acetobacter sp.]